MTLLSTLGLIPVAYLVGGVLTYIHYVYKGIKMMRWKAQRMATVSANQWENEKHGWPEKFGFWDAWEAIPSILIAWPIYVLIEVIYG